MECIGGHVFGKNEKCVICGKTIDDHKIDMLSAELDVRRSAMTGLEAKLVASEQALAMSELSYHNLEEAMVVELENHNEQLKQVEQALAAEWEKREQAEARIMMLKAELSAIDRKRCAGYDAATKRAEQAEAQVAVMREAIKEIAKAPYVIESATIPKAGIESAPEQVVGTLHIVLKRMLRIQAVAQAHDPASTLLAEHKRYGEALERIAYSDWGVVLPEYQQIARAALNKEEPK